MEMLMDTGVWILINGWKVLLGGVMGGVVLVFCAMYDERYML